MKRKIVTVILYVLAIILILIGYGYYNLKSNSVYYAKHIPHKEGTEPVLMMLVDNLSWIYNPDIDGIEYDFDGDNCIRNYNFKDKDVPWFSGYGGEEYHYGSNIAISYSFNNDFKLTSCREIHKEKINIKDVDVKEVKKDIYKMVQPVIDKQTRPLINLQWLFNRIYRDKFN